MSLPTTYFLTVALHAGILSIFATLLLSFFRSPGQRSFIAIAGLLAIGFLPWITALRPAPTPRTLPLIAEIRTASPTELPIWTIATVPMEREIVALPAPPAKTVKKWEMPDLLASLLTLWAAGTGIGIALLVIALAKASMWRKSLTPLDSTAWYGLRDFIADDLTENDFLVCPTTASPCVIGFWRPKIVIPHFLLDPLSAGELRWAVRHEIAHRQAGDSRWIMLFAVIRSVNWWNPFAHRLVTRWADAREQLCDLHATQLTGGRADYGEFLIAMARKITRQPPLAITMAERLHTRRLKQRIVSLLEAKSESVKPPGKGFVSVGSGLFVIIAAGVSLLKIGAEELSARPASESIQETIPQVTNGAGAEEPARSSPSPATASTAQQDMLDFEDLKKKRQVKIFTKFIISDFKLGFNADPVVDGGEFTHLSMFSEGQISVIMKGLSQERGTIFFSSPSITALSGQKGTIEIIDHVLGTPEQIAKRDPKAEIPFLGVSFTPVARFSEKAASPDNTIELNLNVDYRYMPGIYQPRNGTDSKLPEGLDPDQIKVFKKSVHGKLLSGCTLGLVFGEIEPGKYLSVFTKAEIIDGTGRTVDFQKLFDQERSLVVNKRRTDEGTLPQPETRGSLRLSATLVDLPLHKPRPPGEGLVIGLTPTVKSVADKIKNTRGGRVRELKPVEISLNHRITPWPEFPGLNLTAIASRNHQFISMTSHAVGTEENEFPNTWDDLTPGSIMNFGIRTDDPEIERRLLIRIETVK